MRKTDQFNCLLEDVRLVWRAEEERVIVVVPWQGKKVEVVKLPLRMLEELRSDNDDFSPTRLVINFEVRDAGTGDPLRDFDPPIELEVEYTHDDYDTMFILGFWEDEDSEAPEGNPEPPKKSRWIAFGVGLWDHEKRRWRTFTDGKYGFTLQGDLDNGVCKVTIPSWGDAHVGAGE